MAREAPHVCSSGLWGMTTEPRLGDFLTGARVAPRGRSWLVPFRALRPPAAQLLAPVCVGFPSDRETFVRYFFKHRFCPQPRPSSVQMFAQVLAVRTWSASGTLGSLSLLSLCWSQVLELGLQSCDVVRATSTSAVAPEPLTGAAFVVALPGTFSRLRWALGS